MYSVLTRGFDRFLVSRIGVTRHARSWIIGKDTLQSDTHLRRSVGDNYLPGVERISDPYTTTVVERNPRRAARYVQHRVEKRPVGHCIASIAHPFSFAER